MTLCGTVIEKCFVSAGYRQRFCFSTLFWRCFLFHFGWFVPAARRFVTPGQNKGVGCTSVRGGFEMNLGLSGILLRAAKYYATSRGKIQVRYLAGMERIEGELARVLWMLALDTENRIA
jgi:hypothetical protein